MLSSQITRKVIEAYTQMLRDPSIDFEELAKVSHKIFKSLGTGLIFFHLCQEGDITSSIIIEKFGLSESSTFRVLNAFQDMGLIEVIGSLPHKPKQGGPRKMLWGIMR